MPVVTQDLAGSEKPEAPTKVDTATVSSRPPNSSPTNRKNDAFEVFGSDITDKDVLDWGNEELQEVHAATGTLELLNQIATNAKKGAPDNNGRFLEKDLQHQMGAKEGELKIRPVIDNIHKKDVDMATESSKPYSSTTKDDTSEVSFHDITDKDVVFSRAESGQINSWKKKEEPAQKGTSASDVTDKNEQQKVSKTQDSLSNRRIPGIAFTDITDNDVLCFKGRNQFAEHHPGNQNFKALIWAQRDELAKGLSQASAAKKVISTIQSKHGRFLKLDKDSRAWFKVGDAEAVKKVIRAFRKPRKRSLMKSKSMSIPGVTDNDVICAWGNNQFAEHHPGNQRFKALMRAQRNELAKGLSKASATKKVISTIQSKHGRFLRLDEDSRMWRELGDAEALKKVKDAFRRPNKRSVTKLKSSLTKTMRDTDFGIFDSETTVEDFLCCESYASHPGNQKFEALIHSYSCHAVATETSKPVEDIKDFGGSGEGSKRPVVHKAERTACQEQEMDVSAVAESRVTLSKENFSDWLKQKKAVCKGARRNLKNCGRGTGEGDSVGRTSTSSKLVKKPRVPFSSLKNVLDGFSGRFLEKDADSGLWYQLDDTAVLNLTRHALFAGSSSKNASKAVACAVKGILKRKVPSHGFPTGSSKKRQAVAVPSNDAVHTNATDFSDETSTFLGGKERQVDALDHFFAPVSDTTTLDDSRLESVATKVKGGAAVHCMSPPTEMSCITQVDNSKSMEDALVVPGSITTKSNAAFRVHSFTPVGNVPHHVLMESPDRRVEGKSAARNEHLKRPREHRQKADKEIDDSSDQKEIIRLHDHDVVSGRGKGSAAHPGNVFFRHLVRKYKQAYVESKRYQKMRIAKDVINEVESRKPPGRFVENTGIDSYTVLSRKKAQEKVSQAFRDLENASRKLSSPCRKRDAPHFTGPGFPTDSSGKYKVSADQFSSDTVQANDATTLEKSRKPGHRNGNRKRPIIGWIVNRPGTAGP